MAQGESYVGMPASGGVESPGERLLWADYQLDSVGAHEKSQADKVGDG
jgi:hypothetical protein